VLPEIAQQDQTIATAAVAAAAGEDAAGVEGSSHPALVLFDAESNLRLQVRGKGF
jgi:hypothetical protein